MSRRGPPTGHCNSQVVIPGLLLTNFSKYSLSPAFPTLSVLALPFPALSFPALPFLALSFPALPFHALSFPSSVCLCSDYRTRTDSK